MCTGRLSNLFGSSRRARLGFGLVVLLVVDVIWVASAELTKFIFSHQDFDKPFFSVYLKTAIFSSYLLGFLCFPSWRNRCTFCRDKCPSCRSSCSEAKTTEINSVHELPVPLSNGMTESDVIRSVTPPVPCRAMSDSVYEQMTDDDDAASVLTSEDLEDEEASKHVRFRKVKEIRQLTADSPSTSPTQDPVGTTKMSLSETAKLAFLFSFPWLAANLFYQESLSFTSAAVTNILSSTSGIFTLILAAIFKSSPLDGITLSKFLAVLMSLAGIVLVTWSDSSMKKYAVDQGAFYALAGALFYAIYLILLKRRAGNDDRLDIPLFFGFVGIFGAVLFWPGFLILHLARVEKFELPRDSETWLYLLANGVIGTALSELLWVWGCFLTSSLIGTLSLSLVMPLTMVFDMFFNKIHFSVLFLVGTIPVFLSFFAVALLANYEDWDPVLDLTLKLWRVIIRKKNECWKRPDQDERENLMAEDNARQHNDDTNASSLNT